MIMETYFKQKNAYGCGLYALANTLMRESVITQERLEDSENGNNIGQLNKWLIQEGEDLFIEPLYFSSTGKRLPKSITQLKPHGVGVLSLPVLIDVQSVKDGKMHLVAADISPEGNLLVTDSMKEKKELTTLAEYQKRFYRVFGLWALRSYKIDGYCMRFTDQYKTEPAQ